MKPKDFSLKSEYAEIPGANIEDWPISYEELEPYYAKVESIVGVSGRVVEHPFLEPRSTDDYPYKPTSEHIISSWFDKACKKNKLYSIPTARAVLSSDVGERRGCEYSGYCGSYGCSSGAKGSSREALLHKALKTGNCTILAKAFVKTLESDKSRVKSAHYIDKVGNTNEIKADIFVLAAQAIETSRLLLNSANTFFPRGLANNSNQVGKNLLFSAGGSGTGAFYYEDLSAQDADALKTVGPFVNRSLQDWYEITDSSRPVKEKGGTIDFLFEHPNAVSRAKRAMYDGDLVWGDQLKKRLLHNFKQRRIFTFEIFCDWTPNDDCFVSLDEEVKDRWNMPVAKVRLGAHPHDLRIGEHMAKEAEHLLKQMGAREVSSSISASPPQNLQAGGCRFGNDANSSVLNKECRAHEVDNLYISDGSFMPTGGSVPFTWTIYANSFRVADAIIRELEKGKR